MAEPAYSMVVTVPREEALERLRSGGNICISLPRVERTVEVRSVWLRQEPPFYYRYKVIPSPQKGDDPRLDDPDLLDDPEDAIDEARLLLADAS